MVSKKKTCVAYRNTSRFSVSYTVGPILAIFSQLEFLYNVRMLNIDTLTMEKSHWWYSKPFFDTQHTNVTNGPTDRRTELPYRFPHFW